MHFVVITPTHNRLQFLPEAVASVRASVLAPLDISVEHLICENACTDGSAEWLQEAAEQPPVGERGDVERDEHDGRPLLDELEA